MAHPEPASSSSAVGRASHGRGDAPAQPRPGAGRAASIALAVAATVASLLLSLQRVGVLPGTLPGCSTDGGCAALTHSRWAEVPLIAWPWSHVGVAWFAGLSLALISLNGRFSPRLLRGAVLLGALGSVAFLVVMIRLGTFCPWCLAVHLCNAVLTILSFVAPRWRPMRPIETRPTPIGSLFAGAAIAIVCTVALGALEYRNAEAIARASQEVERVMAARAAAALDPSVPSDEVSEDPANASTSVAPPAPDRLAGRHRLGAANAPIQITVFSDYECPDCRRIDADIAQLLQRSDVSVTPRHFPLCADCNRLVPRSLHPDACRRALLAEAAAILGGNDAFAAAHAALFAAQSADGTAASDPISAVLDATKLDRTRLLEAMTSDAARAAIANDIDDAVALGVTYTPMVFVNGHEWKWYQSRGTLVDLVDRVARQALQTVTPPNALERLVADWRAMPLIRAVTASDPQPLPVPRFAGDARSAENEATNERPEVIIALDYTLEGTSLALRELAALAEEGIAFRLAVWQFPANAECNPLPGLPRDATPACLASLLVTATAMTAGVDAAGAVHEWLRTHRDGITLEAIHPMLEALPGGSQVILGAITDGRALERTRQEAAALSSRMQVRTLPTIIVDRRPIPRWEHPGAAPRDLLRTIIAEAAAARLRQKGEIAQPNGLGR